jgi:hypothetical protein
MDISGIVIAVVASGAATALVTAVLNRRIDRANERVSGYSGDKQLDELLDDLQKTAARNGQAIRKLQQRQSDLEDHVDDLYHSIGLEDTPIQERIKAACVPSGGLNVPSGVVSHRNLPGGVRRGAGAAAHAGIGPRDTVRGHCCRGKRRENRR